MSEIESKLAELQAELRELPLEKVEKICVHLGNQVLANSHAERSGYMEKLRSEFQAKWDVARAVLAERKGE